MFRDDSSRMPIGAVSLLALVLFFVLMQIGLQVTQAFADSSGTSASKAVAADPASDQVGATAAEFRVDESGAATYSIPLYGVPGTAGVAPKLSLNYSSQSGNGPLGKGWSIGGLSSISRCRATREAGDFIEGGQPVDGNPAPINYTGTDRYCLDGQRLIPAPSGSPACPALGGATVENLRTEIDSFQRVCAYSLTGAPATWAAFFTVERKDGSTSWYGDRDQYTSSNRLDGYFNSTAPGKEGAALLWAQTRFQDSTGNYIDFFYFNFQPTGDTREHLLSEVRYTGKIVLTGQAGSAFTPYARFVFEYSARPAAQWAYGYQSGGRLVQSRRLDSVASLGVSDQYARFYKLNYVDSSSGSGLSTLASAQECRDNTPQSVCLPATTFEWSQARNEFATRDAWNPGIFGSASKFEGFKLGDVNGDGRPDLVWLKDGQQGERCGSEYINVALGEIDHAGRQHFRPVTSSPICTPTEQMSELGSASWQLFDYNGDGRDDLFMAGAGANDTWGIYASLGEVGQVFNPVNLIAGLTIPVNRQQGGTDRHPQLTDLNGDGLLDVVYDYNDLNVRLMQWDGAKYAWGNARQIVTSGFVAPVDFCATYCDENAPTLRNPNGNYQLYDFDGDASSDLLMTVSYTREFGCNDLAAGGGSSPRDKACNIQVRNRSFFMGVDSITPTQVFMSPYDYESGSFGLVKFGDFNGDGLTDFVKATYFGGPWFGYINTGRGFIPGPALGTIPNDDVIQIADANGDGRADVLYPIGLFAPNRHVFVARFGDAAGGFSGETRLAGDYANACEGSCNPRSTAPIFADLDADGALDFFAIKLDDNADYYLSQSNSKHQPRDVITRIVNGLGSETKLTYAAMTNAAVYRRDASSRDTLGTSYGRGSPVQDLLAPSYVVAKAASSSPNGIAGINAMAEVHYRYAGAKVQAGGRGFLGFDTIETIDPNHAAGYVVSTTAYYQTFPYVGMPAQSTKRAVPTLVYAPSTCLTGTVGNACFSTPGTAHPHLGGTEFSNNSHIWQADSEFAGTAITPFMSGTQIPLHVRTLGTEETLLDPFLGGQQTSRVMTTFTYGGYGNVSATTVDTYTGTSSTPTATVITSNAYVDNTALWRLGRLTASTVTHRRPNKADMVRATTFAYDMAGAATGLLNAERVQPNLGANQDLYKAYALDEFGNRTRATTCAAPAWPCDANNLLFRPATATAIKRTSRTAYDGNGRFPVASYELFWDGSGAVEREVQRVVSRNIFGDVTEARDANNITAIAVTGSFGRPYYTWTQTIPGATPGDSSAGVDSTTTYRRCTQVSCPGGAAFRQKIMTDGAPTQWTYFDVLGRPIMKAAETFNVGVANKDVAASCTNYGATGKPRQVSNPFFLSGTGGSDGPTLPSNVCTAGRDWTTTSYDLLGRPVRVQGPDNAYVDTAYAGLQTIVTDYRRAGLALPTTQTRNGKGEVVQTTDPVGLSLENYYDAAGNVTEVRRNAGRGVIENRFVYDVLGRKIQQFDVDAGYTRYEYNALGELIAQQDRDDSQAQRIENAYDARGRIWQKTVKLSNGTTESLSEFIFDTAPNGLGQLAEEKISGIYATWQGASHLALKFKRTYQYDVLGRPASSTTTIDDVPYPVATQYDPLGRPYKAQDASGSWAKTEYHPRGFPAAVCFSDATTTDPQCYTSAWQRTLAMDAWGHVTSEIRSAGGQLPVTRTYNTLTGRLQSICADKPGTGGSCDLVDEGYGWDAAGNLHTQRKEGRYLETFTYDGLQRLAYGYAEAPLGQASRLSYWAQFDALGNVCAKSQGTATGGQGYAYAGRAGCGLNDVANSQHGGVNGDLVSSPHQVLAVAGNTYTYDAHGNQTFKDAAGTADDRTVRYSVDDKAYVMLKGSTGTPSQVTRFWYGPDGQRYKREDIGGRRTLYLGNVEIITENAVTTTKRYIGGFFLQTIVNAVPSNQYLFHDQLGSLVRITDALGNQVSQMDFVPSGERRSFSDPMQYSAAAPAQTTRGFTGHEQIDALGLIHMNGRIYDPELGRFLQADPVIQSPGDAQSWNAYTYVFNNPLTYTDPSGMMSLRQVLGIVIAIVGTVFAPYFSNFWWGLAYSMGVGALSGYVSTGTLQGAVYGAFAAGLFYGIGSYYQAQGLSNSVNNVYGAGVDTIGASGLTAGQVTGKVIAHGVAGGVMSTLQGGKFGHGFVSAGFTEAVAPGIGNIESPVAQGVVASIAGGTVSVLTGGKFANGAMTAAFSYAFNQTVHSERTVSGYADLPTLPDGVGYFDENGRWIYSGQDWNRVEKFTGNQRAVYSELNEQNSSLVLPIGDIVSLPAKTPGTIFLSRAIEAASPTVLFGNVRGRLQGEYQIGYQQVMYRSVGGQVTRSPMYQHGLIWTRQTIWRTDPYINLQKPSLRACWKCD